MTDIFLQADVFDVLTWRSQLEGAIGVVSTLGAFGSNDFMFKVMKVPCHFWWRCCWCVASRQCTLFQVFRDSQGQQACMLPCIPHHEQLVNLT